MLERLFNTIKTFFQTFETQCPWVKTLLFILFIIGLLIAIGLGVFLYCKTTKELKKLKKEKRKRDKAVLKFLSNKKNKTF